MFINVDAILLTLHHNVFMKLYRYSIARAMHIFSISAHSSSCRMSCICSKVALAFHLYESALSGVTSSMIETHAMGSAASSVGLSTTASFAIGFLVILLSLYLQLSGWCKVNAL